MNVLSLGCQICDWTVRQQIEEGDATKVASFMAEALLLHMEEHGANEALVIGAKMRIVLFDGDSIVTRGDIEVLQTGYFRFIDRKGDKRDIPIRDVLEIRIN